MDPAALEELGGGGRIGSFEPSWTNSSACMRPLPRSSAIQSFASTAGASPAVSWLPRSRALACMFSSSRAWRVALPAAAESGLPPNVENDVTWIVSMISARATTPASAAPLPTPLAKVSMSGTMSWASYPQKCSPVRPQPVWTSSEIRRMPRASSSFWKAPKNPSVGWRTRRPPGSARRSDRRHRRPTPCRASGRGRRHRPR